MVTDLNDAYKMTMTMMMMMMMMVKMMIMLMVMMMMLLRVDDTSDTRVHDIANTFVKFQRTFCFYHKKFLVAEMLNTFCVALSIYISHVLLNQQFIDYGHRVILDFNIKANSSDSWYFVQTDIDICR